MIRVLLLPLLAMSAASCSEDSKGATGEDESPAVEDSVSMRLDREQVESGGSFTVTFERVADDRRKFMIGPGLNLWQGERKLSTLVMRDVFPPESNLAAVWPPDTPLPDRGFSGMGPYRFELPQLDTGQYRVCALVRLTRNDGWHPEGTVITPREADVCQDFELA